MIRLLLVEDQDIFRQGLATLLSVEEDLELVGEASNGMEAIQLTEQLQPDVILMDIRMPVCNGVVATRVFSHLKPHSSTCESADNYLHLLSPRELEVFKLVGKGKNNQEIALLLHLTEGTVKNYITRILSQLNFRDRVSAALWAQLNL